MRNYEWLFLQKFSQNEDNYQLKQNINSQMFQSKDKLKISECESIIHFAKLIFPTKNMFVGNNMFPCNIFCMETCKKS